MSALTALIEQVRGRVSDSTVEGLDREFKHLSERRQFGLNFERHRPEFVELWGHLPRVGQNVRVLPSRDSGEFRDNTVWRVVSVSEKTAKIRLEEEKVEKIEKEVVISDLLPVAEFGQQIFPGLNYIDEICNGGGGQLNHRTL